MTSYCEMVVRIVQRLAASSVAQASKQEKKRRQRWVDEHINFRADTVRAQFAYYRHVIPVSYQAIYGSRQYFMTWPAGAGAPALLVPELESMRWPARSSQDAIHVAVKRVVQIDNDWRLDDWGGGDQAFVMTNNDQEALWIALKYS